MKFYRTNWQTNSWFKLLEDYVAVDDAQYYTTTNVNVVDVYIRYQFYYPPSFVRSSVQKPFQKSKCNETKILVHYILSS